MAQMLIYEKPVILNKQAHRNLRFTPLKDFSFARTVSLAPLMAVEFSRAAGIYPILMAQPPAGAAGAPGAAGGAVALALLSVTQQTNSYVDDKGQWTATYIPAFIRRYPWVLATMPDKKGELGVAFDEASGCFSEDNGTPLFEGEQPSKLLAGQIEFLKGFHAETTRTQAFLATLKKDDLLVPFNVDIVRGTDKKRYAVRDMLAVDETRLMKLGSDRAAEYLRNGWMGLVYAHLLSLRNLPNVSNRAAGVDEAVPWWSK